LAIRISPDEITPTLVKRIVGVGGDTLVMRHGQLMVNGHAVASPNSFVLPDSLADQPQAVFSWQHQIEIPGSRFGAPVSAPSLHEWGPIVVPYGAFFMMGDNGTTQSIAGTTGQCRAPTFVVLQCSFTTRTTPTRALSISEP
jgi:signal peptidase I